MKVIKKRVHVTDSKPALRIEIELPLAVDGFQTTNADFMASFVQAVKDYEDQKQDTVEFADDVPILARLRYGVEFPESLTSYDIEAAVDEIERLRRIIYNLLDDGDETDRAEARTALGEEKPFEDRWDNA